MMKRTGNSLFGARTANLGFAVAWSFFLLLATVSTVEAGGCDDLKGLLHDKKSLEGFKFDSRQGCADKIEVEIVEDLVSRYWESIDPDLRPAFEEQYGGGEVGDTIRVIGEVYAQYKGGKDTDRGSVNAALIKEIRSSRGEMSLEDVFLITGVEYSTEVGEKGIADNSMVVNIKALGDLANKKRSEASGFVAAIREAGGIYSFLAKFYEAEKRLTSASNKIEEMLAGQNDKVIEYVAREFMKRVESGEESHLKVTYSDEGRLGFLRLVVILVAILSVGAVAFNYMTLYRVGALPSWLMLPRTRRGPTGWPPTRNEGGDGEMATAERLDKVIEFSEHLKTRVIEVENAVRLDRGEYSERVKLLIEASVTKLRSELQIAMDGYGRRIGGLEGKLADRAAKQRQLEEQVRRAGERQVEREEGKESDTAATRQKRQAAPRSGLPPSRAQAQSPPPQLPRSVPSPSSLVPSSTGTTLSAHPTGSAEELRDFERDVLRQSWANFHKTYQKDIDDLLKITDDSKWKKMREILVSDFPDAVRHEREIYDSYAGVIMPFRDFDALAYRLAMIPRLINNDLPPLSDVVKDMVRIRESTTLLSLIQGSEQGVRRLQFNVSVWVASRFRNFADFFLKKYQEAQQGGRSGPLDEGLRLVCEILRWAGEEPFKIELGVTTFDSREHVGRSSVNNPDYEDGVIVGVVRNGFRKINGEVIRQPEVVVNRR